MAIYCPNCGGPSKGGTCDSCVERRERRDFEERILEVHRRLARELLAIFADFRKVAGVTAGDLAPIRLSAEIVRECVEAVRGFDPKLVAGKLDEAVWAMRELSLKVNVEDELGRSV